jgi:putative flippase GtrA
VKRAIRFYAVGAAGMAVQLAALALYKSGFGVGYLAATALAVETAVLHNFIWHERWTWSDRRLAARRWPERLLRFHLTNGLLSIAGNVVFMAALVGWLGIPYLAANVASIGLCSLLNYVAADRLVFRRGAAPLPG